MNLQSTLLLSIVFLLPSLSRSAEVDLSELNPSGGVTAKVDGKALALRWPVADGETAEIALSLDADRPLFSKFALVTNDEERVLLEDVDPVAYVTVGERQFKNNPAGRWTVFFDRVHLRPHQTHRTEHLRESFRVAGEKGRATVTVPGVSAGPFSGDLVLSVYSGSRLLLVEFVLATEEDRRAAVYDAGLVSGNEPSWSHVGWMDTAGKVVEVKVDPRQEATPRAVRHRMILATGESGSVAVFPPPHRYFYPLDFSDNFEFVWHGRGARGTDDGTGLGIRQKLEGDRRFVPWFNAPPGTKQRMGFFCLLGGGDASETIARVKRYTRDDRFEKLPGHVRFTSHYHVEHTTDLAKRQEEGWTPGSVKIPEDLEVPGFVQKFRSHGIDIVHLAEFHFGHTPRLAAPERLRLLDLLHRECRRLSDDSFLLLPGEEPNVHLGGHWISLFPEPVYWVLNRREGQPFRQEHPDYGTVYHVGSAEEVLELFEQEKGLMWTAHPRIKSSTGFPDRYRERDFYLSDRFLGAAWKAMPADLSIPRLGTRVLDLQDDMANWGQKKYIVGEVDVFQVFPDHELYGHLNVNYLRLDRIPRYEDGWQPVLDALRGGEFFITTGEVLIPNFTVGGRQSGETLKVAGAKQVEIKAELRWTFPLDRVEIISGDSRKVYRESIDLSDTRAFGSRTLKLDVDLTGRTWVRLEVWDIATNGAFTSPVWLE